MTDCSHVEKALDRLLSWMTRGVDEIKMIPRQAYIKCLYECPSRELVCDKNVAENANALSRNHRLDRVQLLPKT